jgi:serine/threonine protein kinase
MICGYCNGGNLFDYQNRLPNRVIPLEKTMEIISQVLKGLQEIHE